MNTMTPEERIDVALDSVLREVGTSLSNCTSKQKLARMRGVIREVMSDYYIAGSNANYEAMRDAGKLTHY